MTSPYVSAIDWARLDREYPTGADFLETYVGMSRSTLESEQDRRLRRALDAAWDTPFYRRIWSEAGIDRRDITGMADLGSLPIIDKSMILADVEENPPFGSLPQRIEARRGPMILQTTSGTTGNPQPVLWGAWGREVQNALLGRIYCWLGVGRDDIAHSVYGHGVVNGGHYVREALTRYTEALLVSAGTGIETKSERQIAIMQQFGVTVLLGFADYLRKLADVAAEAGIQPGRDIPVRLIIGHLLAGGREPLEQAWGGAPAYNWYGVADTGAVATEGPERDGLHVWEDANILEIVDEHGTVLPDGLVGDMVVTSLGKDDVAPLIRFNTHDLTRIVPGANPTGLPFRRMEGLLGRSDSMVKLKGINVYPTALGGMLAQTPGFTGEYVCIAERAGHGDRLTVQVEIDSAIGADAADLARSLSTRLGVGVEVEVVAPGGTAPLTGVHERQKPVRLVDRRG